jgi:hypothetical protein
MMIKNRFSLAIAVFLSCSCFAQGVGVGKRIDLTKKLQLNVSGGQFAQLFVPDYFVAPGDSLITLVYHLHSASWAAEDEVYKSKTNAVLFNIHLGALSSPYQNYFADQNVFQKTIDTILSVLHSEGVVSSPRIRHMIITSFSAGYAGVRAFLKVQSYYDRISALNLADGLHCNSDASTKQIQMKDFLRFAKDARDKKKIMLITHSSITTSGYENTTQTADYLISGMGTTRNPFNSTDEIGIEYSRADTGNFHLRGYRGITADDHLKHLYGMHLMLSQAMSIPNSGPVGVGQYGFSEESFLLFQNYPNPFNASTVIRFSLNRRQYLTLKVFDTLGREVTTLAEGEVEPGDHFYVFNMSGLSSGSYIYRLTSANLVQTRKMIFLK